MKTLLLFSFGLLVSPASFATTELLEATELGRTHVDPVNMSTFINYSTDYDYKNPKVTYAKCQIDEKTGKPILNVFFIKKNDEKGVTRNSFIIKPGSNCNEIINSDTAIVRCDEHSALVMSVSDPDECAQGKCTKLSSPRTASTPLNINLGESNEKLNQEIDKCSPDRRLIVLTDGKKSMVAGLNDKSHCGLENKRIITEGAPWDDEESEHTKIYTSSRGGFFVGQHTHYYFDYAKKEWCIHFRPDIGSTAPVCGFNGYTRSLAFGVPGEDTKQKGAVSLTVDKDGNPKAVIGHPKSKVYSRSPELDTTKPVLDITLVNKEGQQRKAIFKTKKSIDGETLRTVTISPNYTMGTQVATAGSCDNNACLSGPKEILDPASPLQCAKTADQHFTMPTGGDKGKDMCYSCNGITSGACDDDKTLLTKANVEKYSSNVRSCRSNDNAPTEAQEEPATTVQ